MAKRDPSTPLRFARDDVLRRPGALALDWLVVETLAPGELPALLVEAKKARKFVEDLVG
jgi:hypothetical protein